MANLIPVNSFGFKVLIDGKELGLFQEVSGLSVQVNVTDLAEGGLNTSTHKLIEGVSYSNVTLKRGLCDASGLYTFILPAINGEIDKLRIGTVTIISLDESGNEGMKYELKDAVPVKWDGPSLNVMQDSIATETLELAHEGLTVK